MLDRRSFLKFLGAVSGLFALSKIPAPEVEAKLPPGPPKPIRPAEEPLPPPPPPIVEYMSPLASGSIIQGYYFGGPTGTTFYLAPSPRAKEFEWRCDYCDAFHQRTDHTFCPNCGGPRPHVRSMAT